MKSVFKVISFALLMFIFPLIVKANSISSIDMDIYLDDNGTAHVTETWSAYLDQGTEGYKPYYNIGNAKIKNFKVSENGQTYTYNDYWNTNASFSEKAYKNGINYLSDGLELCWGISEYGYHDYVLTYDIEGFVSSLNDADMVYWNLIPYELSSKPGNVHIRIYADEYFSQDLDVWGFGNYGGTAYVYNGYIEMNSEGTLESNEYMTILVKFDKGTFNTSNAINEDFDYYLDMAKEGTTKYKESFFQKFIDVITYIFDILLSLLPVIIIMIIAVITSKNMRNKLGTRSFSFTKDERKLPKDVPNYRDIPFNKDIFRAYWVSSCYGLNKNQTDFLGAILLKWLLEKKIEVKKVQAGLIIKKEESAIVLKSDTFTSDNELELELHQMMAEASKDDVLESKEFEKWCKNNYNKILKWFDKVIDSETDKLIIEGKITETVKNNLFKTKVLKVDPSMKEEGVKLKGLKNFLEEFSRIDDKTAIEVNMWEYYLIYAQILGIADKVAKQFEKLYPELLEDTYNRMGCSFTDFVFINSLAHTSMHAAISSRQRAQSYHSGGGGFSSGGGGGGSFGGGGGGGGFR
ncbi:MAG TPA: DUF2207 domain-containing protein [Candidatus Aphodocola excrementigallinarum]|uniref:DUF2207 domain-containing protein n=1 Tax=Candidatus Aphodocola excrementigallinarum TaxID=2840670 RepID=A0A9D1IP13_9FIRM|nr:DUF2207 domain-containing protein [Candidatus Aphodocola excrementigallinarum]